MHAGAAVYFFKQKTAYEMRISDWSSDVCSSDLCRIVPRSSAGCATCRRRARSDRSGGGGPQPGSPYSAQQIADDAELGEIADEDNHEGRAGGTRRAEENTSELQSLMRISYAVFCLKKKNKNHTSTILVILR